MALDPNIILQAGRGVTKLLTPDEIADARAQRELSSYKLQTLRQGMDDDMAQREIARSTAPEGLAGAFYKAGLVKPAQEAIKFQTDQQKAQREAQKAKIEQGIAQIDAIGRVMSGVKDQASYDAARQQAAQLFGAEAAANLDPVYNPDAIAQRQQQALSVKDRLEQERKKFEFENPSASARLTAETSTANNRATIAQSAQNAQMTDARMREQNAIRAQGNAQGKTPSGYEADPENPGALRFIKGGPADPTSKAGGGKPLTEGQSKSLVYAARMEEANDLIDEIALGPKGDGKGRTTAVPGSLGKLTGDFITALSSSENQKLVQAKRDYMTAVLRRESGAVIADDEMANGDRQYFPQVGDSAAVIEQKRRNRQIATRGIAADVPEADRRIREVRGKGAPASGAATAPAQRKTIGGKTYENDGKGWYPVE